MGDIVDLNTRTALSLDGQRASEDEAHLLSEGLELLADFRVITDPAIRESIVRMVASVAEAFRGEAWYVRDR